MADTRVERDTMGEMLLPADALYGAQTQRAVENFPVSGEPMRGGAASLSPGSKRFLFASRDSSRRVRPLLLGRRA